MQYYSLTCQGSPLSQRGSLTFKIWMVALRGSLAYSMVTWVILLTLYMLTVVCVRARERERERARERERERKREREERVRERVCVRVCVRSVSVV